MGPDRQVLAAIVATRYYLEGQTKSEIAEQLSISRFQVARLLAAGRTEGIVRITVELPSGIDAGLSDRLGRAFGLRRALVVNAPEDPVALRQYLGRAAAALLTDLITEDDCLGIAWGRTLGAIPSALERLAACPVVQITGVAGTISENSVELVRQIAAVSGGPASPIYAPLVVADAATARGLRRQPGIAQALRLHGHVTHAVVAVGSWRPPDSQLLDSLPAAERKRLLARGVCAEICGTLLAADGSVVRGLQERCIAVSTTRLRAIPDVIAVAGGPSKTDAIHAALRSGLVDGLVTDSSVAHALLTGTG